MDDHAELTRRLADLVVGYGANVQPGQIVGVTTYTGKEALTREVARAAYERGASWVDVVTFDPWVKRQRLAHADESTLEYIPPWLDGAPRVALGRARGTVTLNGPAAPDALDGIDPARAGRDILPYLPRTPARSSTSARRTGAWPPRRRAAGRGSSTRSSTPTRRTTGSGRRSRTSAGSTSDDPEAAWRERARNLDGAAARLTGRRFDAIRLHGPGTDLTVGLLPSSTWHAADFETVDGLRHFPNIPSEEIFTTPDPARVDGHVTATRPLELYGALIDGIRVEFEGGRAVRIDADRGADTMRAIAAKDDGGSRLGELALVDGEGRIGAARHGLLRDADRRERREPHRARERLHARRGVRRRPRAGQPLEHPRGLHDRLAPSSTSTGSRADGAAVPLLRGGAWQL